jgi:conjugative transposon TraM protein
MSINFKQPKYILPLILLPFLCLFFFVYQSSSVKVKVVTRQGPGINGTVGDVSPDIKKQALADKLDAYRNAYKEGDGMTAVNALPSEQSTNPAYDNTYSEKEKRVLDSINLAMKEKYNLRGNQPVSAGYRKDQAMAEALKGLSNRQQNSSVASSPPKEKDPMETFRQQMAYLDSINKANDPAVKAEKAKRDALARKEARKATEPSLSVHKATGATADFNTVRPMPAADFIKVVIDENLTGYVGSRVRLRLLDDISVGTDLIPKDTYLFALINGFSGQRVTLSVKSVLFNDKILPVKLEIYDLDGLPGLYVPESAFRDFTKDLGSNTVQGVTIDDSGTGSAASQLMMSSVDKLFESTSSAIAGIIRKNKAKIKYNSYLYLIDTKDLNQ